MRSTAAIELTGSRGDGGVIVRDQRDRDDAKLCSASSNPSIRPTIVWSEVAAGSGWASRDDRGSLNCMGERFELQ